MNNIILSKLNLADILMNLGIIYPSFIPSHNFVRNFLNSETINNPIFLDIGSGSKKWTRDISRLGGKYITVDYPERHVFFTGKHFEVDKFARPDVWGDAHYLPFKENSIQRVLIIDVLEHVHNPFKVIKEIAEVLAPRGRVCITTPYLMEVHGGERGDADFFRLSKSAVKSLSQSSKMEIIENKYIGNLGGSLTTLLAGFIIRTFINGGNLKKKIIAIFLSIPIFIFFRITYNLWEWLDETQVNPSFTCAIIEKKY